jgi:hypothetical protein
MSKLPTTKAAGISGTTSQLIPPLKQRAFGHPSRKWYAINAVTESIRETKKLLYKKNVLSFWFKLVLIVVLADGLGGVDAGRIIQAMNGGGLNPGLMTFAIFALASVLFINLIFMYISLVFKFVYVKILLREEKGFFRDSNEQSVNGLKMFSFQVLLGVFFLLYLLAGTFFAGLAIGLIKSGFFRILFIVLGVIILIITFIVLMFIVWLINEFVIPIMYKLEVGVLQGIRIIQDSIKQRLTQFIMYGVIRFSLGVLTGLIIFSLSISLFFIIFTIALFLDFGFLLGLTDLQGIIITPQNLMSIVLGILIMVIITFVVNYLIMCVTLPISVFYRYYCLIFLDRVVPDLNLFTSNEKNNKEVPKSGERVRVY